MTVDYRAIRDALETHALSLGVFGAVNGHEPRSAPAYGDSLVLAFVVGPMQPVRSSGLNVLSYRLEVLGRIYRTDKIGSDDVDPECVTAAFSLFSSLAAGFTLGGLIRCVDFLGSDGEGLSAEPGYADQGEDQYRIIDIMIPLIINDVSDLAR
jgi:hypothetical protein